MYGTFVVVDNADYRLVVLRGDVDDANVADVSLACTCSRPVVVDLRTCTYLDSSGLNVLIARARDTELALVVTPDSRVYRIFEITGLLAYFPTAPTVDEAASLLGNGSRSERP